MDILFPASGCRAVNQSYARFLKSKILSLGIANTECMTLDQANIQSAKRRRICSLTQGLPVSCPNSFAHELAGSHQQCHIKYKRQRKNGPSQQALRQWKRGKSLNPLPNKVLVQ